MFNKIDPKGSKNDPKESKNGQKIGFCPSVMANQIHYFFFYASNWKKVKCVGELLIIEKKKLHLVRLEECSLVLPLGKLSSESLRSVNPETLILTPYTKMCPQKVTIFIGSTH